MKIVIKKKAFTPPVAAPKGDCAVCSKWSQTTTPPEKQKRGLGNCALHGCFTPKDGSCNGFKGK